MVNLKGYYSAAQTGAEELKPLKAGGSQILVVDDLQEVQGRVRQEDYAKALRDLAVRREIF